MSTAPPMHPPWMAMMTGMRRFSMRVKVACMSVSRSKMAARPSGLRSSSVMAPPKVSSAMPALKCLPVLLTTSARASPDWCRWASTSSSSRQNVGCMVFIASGRFSTRCATWSVMRRVKQVKVVFMGATVDPGGGAWSSPGRLVVFLGAGAYPSSATSYRNWSDCCLGAGLPGCQSPPPPPQPPPPQLPPSPAPSLPPPSELSAPPKSPELPL